MRLLLLDLAEEHLCDQLQGSFVGLPEEDEREGSDAGHTPSAGRLWVQECAAHIENRHAPSEARLFLTLRGPGWTWVEHSADGPLGSSFTVNGHLRFTAELSLSGVLDVAYDERRRVVSLWLTPRTPAAASVVPTGTIPVEPDGGWSSIIASLGSWFGPNLEERAAPMVEAQGSAQMAEQLSRGFTFTVNLCTGQTDGMVGPLANGTLPSRPYPAGEGRWLDNARVKLRSEGLDAFGAFPAAEQPLRLDLEIEEGDAVRLAAYCAPDGEAGVRRYLDATNVDTPGDDDADRATLRASPLWRTLVRSGEPRSYLLPQADCPMVVLAEPLPEAEPVVFRYRVFRHGADIAPLVACPARPPHPPAN